MATQPAATKSLKVADTQTWVPCSQEEVESSSAIASVEDKHRSFPVRSPESEDSEEVSDVKQDRGSEEENRGASRRDRRMNRTVIGNCMERKVVDAAGGENE